VLNRYLGQGATYEAAQRLPGVNRLERDAGLRVRVQVTARLEDARPGDMVALVSNGLYNAVLDQQMVSILADRTPLDATAGSLVSVAQAHDVSCILLRWIAAAKAPNVAAHDSTMGP
jgi:serine/threonine protein phosphatase PrpC